MLFPEDIISNLLLSEPMLLMVFCYFLISGFLNLAVFLWLQKYSFDRQTAKESFKEKIFTTIFYLSTGGFVFPIALGSTLLIFVGQKLWNFASKVAAEQEIS